MSEEFNDTILQKFLDTAMERHRVYLKKEAGQPKPWSDDPIYQNFFFCNLFRQYDKCSKWIIENIIPYKRWDLVILYRFISTYETYLRLQKEGVPLDDLNKIKDWMVLQKTLNIKMFSSCFIRNPRIRGGWAETYQVPFHLIEEIRDSGNIHDVFKLNSLEKMVEYLSRFSGTKGFMGYEYACDFEYFPGWNPTDKYTWANMGPGAMGGMSLVKYGHRNKKMRQDEWLWNAQILREKMEHQFNREFPNNPEEITMREVEHWLCEFQKYVKYNSMIKNGTKVKHRKYYGRF